MPRSTPVILAMALAATLGCGCGGTGAGKTSGSGTGPSTADARTDAISDAGSGDEQSDAPASQLPIECTPAPMCGQPTFGSCPCPVGRGCGYGAGTVYASCTDKRQRANGERPLREQGPPAEERQDAQSAPVRARARSRTRMAGGSPELCADEPRW